MAGTNSSTAISADVFHKVDAIAKRIERFAIKPTFSRELERRRTKPDFSLSDSQMMQRMIELIAFSEQAQSKLVANLRDSGVFHRVFSDFDPAKVAQLDPTALRERHWNNPAFPNENLTPIRFPHKLDRMVSCARGLVKLSTAYGSLMRHLEVQKLHRDFESEADVDAFWSGFAAVRDDFSVAGMSSFKNFVTLCHLLCDLGFNCAKPDSVVLKTATKLGIVDAKKTFSEREKRRVVNVMQAYTVDRGIRTPVVDLYFLIDGRQTEAASLVDPNYYSSST